MRISCIQAPDMQSALEEIRGRLGPDAVIISTRGLGITPDEKRRGLTGIEVVAGVDDHPAARLAATQAAQPALGRQRNGLAAAAESITDAGQRVTPLRVPHIDRFGEPVSSGFGAPIWQVSTAAQVDDPTPVTVIASEPAMPELVPARAVQATAPMNYIPTSPARAAAPSLVPSSMAAAVTQAAPMQVPAMPQSEPRATASAQFASAMQAAQAASAPQWTAPASAQPAPRPSAPAAAAAPSGQSRSAAHAAAERTYEMLRGVGLGEEVAADILEEAIGMMPLSSIASADRLLEVALSRLIAALPAGPTLDPDQLTGQTLFFIGASGVGKTTALLKAALTLRQAGADVLVIGADVSHLGALEQLMGYGKLLHLPVEVAYTPEDLRRLTAGTHRTITLVDTPACRPGSAAEQDLLELLAAAPNALPVLTVPAGAGDVELERLRQTARITGAAAIALTKLDEAGITGAEQQRGAGTALNVLAHLRLPPLLCSTGRDVLSDCALLSTTDLAVTALESAATAA